MDNTTAYRQRLTEKGYRQTSLWLHEDTLSALDAMDYRSRAAAIEALLANRSDNRRQYDAIAQALNWDRTEFDTLDELLDYLREHEHRRGGVVSRLASKVSLLLQARDTLLAAYSAGDKPWTFATQDVCRMILDSCEETSAVLRGTEYYPGSTILLQTAQLVAWRDADGQAHCERAHRVTLNPDRDGLAAAILSGIAGAQIAPEHIAELRAQMGGVL